MSDYDYADHSTHCTPKGELERELDMERRAVAALKNLYRDESGLRKIIRLRENAAALAAEGNEERFFATLAKGVAELDERFFDTE